MCTSLGDLFGKLTVVPAFTRSTFGRNASSVVFPPTPIATVFGATLVDARSAFPFAQPAVCWSSACAFTWSGVFGTAAPAGLTTTRASIPGWSVQTNLKLPACGNVYVAVAGGAFGPCGLSAPLDAGAFPAIVFGPNGPNAARL